MSGNSLFPIFKAYDCLNQILGEEPGKTKAIQYTVVLHFIIAILLKVTKIQFLKCNFHFLYSLSELDIQRNLKIKPGLIRLGFGLPGSGERLRSPQPTTQMYPSGHGALEFVLNSPTFSCWLSLKVKGLIF